MATGSHKGGALSWSDPFLLEDQLTPEERTAFQLILP